MLEIRCKKLRESAKLPTYKTEGAAAADLSADLDSPLTILPGERKLIGTGISISGGQRNDFAALVFSRSGAGAKSGVTLANSLGVIDSDYRGEIKVALINHGEEPFVVNPGDRIAQMMFVPVFAASLIESDELDDTARGEQGFGSTGKQ